MAIHRVHKTKDYSVISNVHLRDANLSLKTKGLLSLMLSLPDDWNYSRDGLIQQVKEGRAVIDACLKELEDNNYLVRTQTRDAKGRLAECIYDIYEIPQTKKPLAEKPTTDNPTTEKPTADNQPQLNTNITNITNINTNLLNKQNTNTDVWFEGFWNVYPKKVNRKNAEKAWKAAMKSKADVHDIAKGLDAWKRYWAMQKTDIQYIPYPSSWLNARSWEDAPKVQSVEDKFNEMEFDF